MAARCFGLHERPHACCEPGKKITISSIVAGAKKEGKVSWGTYLDEKEGWRGSTRPFKRIPIYQDRIYPSQATARALDVGDAGGEFPYDAMMVRPNLIAQHNNSVTFSRLSIGAIFGIEARMIHADGFGVSVVPTPIVIVYNKISSPKSRPKTGPTVMILTTKALVTLVDASIRWPLGAFGENGRSISPRNCWPTSSLVSGNTNSRHCRHGEICSSVRRGTARSIGM